MTIDGIVASWDIGTRGAAVPVNNPHLGDGNDLGARPSGATRGLYERLGFTYDRPKGLKNCVMVKTVDPA